MASDHITHINDDSFDKLVSSSTVPVLVDFWAPWCGPCRAIAPILDQLAESYGEKVKIAKYNIDDSNEAAMKYGVSAVPTLLLFKGGKVVDQNIGNAPKPKLEAMLNAHV